MDNNHSLREFDDLVNDGPVDDAEDQWDNMEEIIDNLTGRDPQVEQTILNSENPKWAYWYAHDVIKGRWSEAEPVIMKGPKWAYFYTHDIIKGRWSEAEPFIMKDSKYYAKRYMCFIAG
jgi:hypothetical protein